MSSFKILRLISVILISASSFLVVLPYQARASGGTTPITYAWVNHVGNVQTAEHVASSANGSTLATTLNSTADYIYISNDGGTYWVADTASGQRNWSAIAISADGTHLAATDFGGYVYTSSDSGSSWTTRTNSGQRYWSSIASSADGSHLVAGAANDYIYTSNDHGATWTRQSNSGQHFWTSIGSSYDGNDLVAAGDSATTVYNGDGSVAGYQPTAGYVYVSTDAGVTWTQETTPGSYAWSTVATSNDGTYMYALSGSQGYLYESTDRGVTWQFNTASSGLNFGILGVSGDGLHITALKAGSGTYSSTDGGVTFNPDYTASPPDSGVSMALSADASKVVVAKGSFGGIYVGTQYSSPIISNISSGAPGSNDASIVWNTDTYNEIGGVVYGTTTSYGSSVTSSVPSNSLYQGFVLPNLLPNTTYHYQVQVSDAQGTTTSPDETFTTAPYYTKGTGTGVGGYDPTTFYFTPSDGATVSGSSVQISTASNPGGGSDFPVETQLYVDTTLIAAESTGYIASTTWNSHLVPNGTHTITALTVTQAGYYATSTISVTVNNPVDTTPPSVSFSSPSNGSTVSGASVSLTASASDNTAVYGVRFYVDSVPLGVQDTSSPYATTWDSTGVVDGSHTLKAVAEDTSGNYATSTISVTVSNSQGGGGGGGNPPPAAPVISSIA